MRKLAMTLLLPLSLFAQEYMGEFSLDTNVYEVTSFQTGGFSGLNNISPVQFGTLEFLRAYRKKGTREFDIFTQFFTKIGSIIIPPSVNIDAIYWLFFTQTFLDEDLGWEYILNYYYFGVQSFSVFDDSGDKLISDTLSANYGFDGQNTYIYAQTYPTTKVWKFRTNISPTSQPLSKTTSSPRPMMTFIPSGDFRVSLQPANGGTSVQIFDFLGRQVFRKTIQNINKPTSFTIPSSEMPNSPFVTRVQNGNGSFVKKEVSVR